MEMRHIAIQRKCFLRSDMPTTQEVKCQYQASGNPSEHPENFDMFKLKLQVNPATLDNLRGKRGACSVCHKKCGLVCFKCRKSNVLEVC